jgi:hypothetical protein
MAMGRPCCCANASTSAASATGRSLPATIGAPTRRATSRAETLSPSARMAEGGGPIHVRPAASTASAKAAFSDRNPYPGCTASAPDAAATASRALMFR